MTMDSPPEPDPYLALLAALSEYDRSYTRAGYAASMVPVAVVSEYSLNHAPSSHAP